MYETLIEKINYQFKKVDLLKQALSHRSYSKVHNERLEFLGDSIVNCVIAIELYRRFPEAQEGQLSRIRANLVNGDTLAEIAKDFDIGSELRLGPGEMRSGGTERPSILADTVEAIIGAIFQDSDMQTCHQIIKGWYENRLNDVSLDEEYKDPKSLLQEYLQARQLPLPEYDLVSISGEEHAQHFTMECHVALLKEPIVGEGSNRRRAEQDAAKHVMDILEGEL